MQDERAADGTEHRLQDVAAARSAMADALDVGTSSLKGDVPDEDGDLFTVHASALGADADAFAEPARHAPSASPAQDAVPASGEDPSLIVR